jgi:hypothetical protein
LPLLELYLDEGTEPSAAALPLAQCTSQRVGVQVRRGHGLDDEIIPSQERIESVADDADLEEVYDTERHLLYVACTRARDHLLVTGAEPVSEFLTDLLSARQERQPAYLRLDAFCQQNRNHRYLRGSRWLVYVCQHS